MLVEGVISSTLTSNVVDVTFDILKNLPLAGSDDLGYVWLVPLLSLPQVKVNALSANLKTFDEFRIQADGTSDSYTISYTPSSKGSLLVTVDGVVQASANFNLSGRSISFDSNLDSGAFLRVVDYGHKAGVFIPVDGSVTQGKLADDAVQVQNLDSSLVYTNIPIRVNTQNISVPFTIDSSKNASVIGPITVDSNVTITVNGNFTII